MFSFNRISILLLIALTLSTAFSCKKDDDDSELTNTGVFSGMKYKGTYLVPKRTQDPVLQNNTFTVSNQYIYGINNDGLYQMDFDGTSKVLFPGNWSTMAQITYASDGFLYLSQSSPSHPWNEIVKMDETGTVIDTYPLPEKRHGNFGIDAIKGNVYLTHSSNKYEIHCFNLVTGDSVTTIGTSGGGDADFPSPVSVVGSDQEGYVYVRMTQQDKGMIFNYDGSFNKSIADIGTRFYSWRGGYYVTQNTMNVTKFNDGTGTNVGSHIHNLDANGYGFQEELSPDGKTAVIKLVEDFYIYQK
ncbi:MAG: hypothetical protein ACPGD5_00325 [Salibacteraceae bacterium]